MSHNPNDDEGSACSSTRAVRPHKQPSRRNLMSGADDGEKEQPSFSRTSTGGSRRNLLSGIDETSRESSSRGSGSCSRASRPNPMTSSHFEQESFPSLTESSVDTHTVDGGTSKASRVSMESRSSRTSKESGASNHSASSASEQAARHVPHRDEEDSRPKAAVPSAATFRLSKIRSNRPLPRKRLVHRIVKRLLSPPTRRRRQSLSNTTGGGDCCSALAITSVPDEIEGTNLSISGVGKTTLAALVTSRSDVRRHYHGGVVWLRLGNRSSSCRLGGGSLFGMGYEYYISCLTSICEQLQWDDDDEGEEDGGPKGKPKWEKNLKVPLEGMSVRRKREEALMIEAKERMEQILHERGGPVLVVLDDVWDDDDVDWFRFAAPIPSSSLPTAAEGSSGGVQLLLTTRVRNMAAGWTCEVNLLAEDESLDLLDMESDHTIDKSMLTTDEARDVVRLCGYHPLTVRTVGRWFRLKQATAGAEDALRELVSDLKACSKACKEEEDSGGGVLLYAIVDMMLSPMMAGRFTKLMKLCLLALTVVFFGHESDSNSVQAKAVPLAVVQLLWESMLNSEKRAKAEVGNLRPKERSRQILLITEALSSLGVIDITTQADAAAGDGGKSSQSQYVRLHHEILEDYAVRLSTDQESLGTEVTDNTAARWHGAFVSAYLAKKAESDKQGSKDIYSPYALEHLVSHMIRAGLVQKAEALLKDDRFVRDRLTLLGWERGTALHIKDSESLNRKCRFDRANNGVTASIDGKLNAFLCAQVKSGDEESVRVAGSCLYEIGLALAEKSSWFQAISQYKMSLIFLPRPSELVATILYSMGVVFLELDDHENALESLGECLEIRQETVGSNDPLYAQTIHKIGDGLAAVSDYGRAIEHYDEAVDIVDTDCVSDRLLISDIIHSKGCVYYSQRKLKEAMKLFESCLRWKKVDLGENSPDLAPTYYRMGSVHSALGNESDAVQCFKETVRLLERNNTISDSANADILLAKGRIHQAKGEMEDCLARFEKALKIVRNSPRHREERIADLLHLIAGVHSENGDDKRALMTLEESLHRRRKDSDSLEVADTLFDMGSVRYRCEEFEEALGDFEKCLRIRRSHLSDGDQIADALEMIGNTRKSLGQHEKVDRIYNEVLRIRETQYGEDHELVATTLQEIADLQNKLSKYDEALAIYRRCLAIRKRRLGKDHADVGDTLHGMGVTLYNRGKIDEAFDCFDEALRIRRTCGPDLPIVGDTLHTMGAVESQRGEHAKALHHLLEALHVRKKSGNKLKVCDTLTHIGNAYRETEQFQLAVRYYEECLSICTGELGEDHEKVGDLYGALARTKADVGASAEALESYKSALKIATSVYGESNDKVATIHFHMGVLQFDMNDPDRSSQNLGEFIRIRESNKTLYDIDDVRALLVLGKIYHMQGEKEQAHGAWSNAQNIYEANSFAVQYPAVGRELVEKLQGSESNKGKGGRPSLIRRISKRLGDEVHVANRRYNQL